MADNSTTITCGTVGNPCKNSDDYPVCHPKDEEAGWVGLEEVIVCEYEDGTKDFRLLLPGEEAPESCKTARPPELEDDGETRYTNENELATLLESDFLTKMGLKGVCQAPYVGGGKPASWYGYVDNAGHAAFLTLHNKGRPSSLHDQDGIWISYAEMMGLASSEELNLQQVDLVCSSAPKLKREEGKDGDVDRSYSPGRYHFKKDRHSLERILEVLKDDDIRIDGFDGDRRQWLIRRFERIHEEVTKGDNTLWWIIGSGAVTQLIFIGAILFQDKIRTFFSKLFPSISGKTDARKPVEQAVKANPNYHVKGLTGEAIDAWKLVDDPDFPNLIVKGDTGSGKDMLIKEMIRLLVVKDSRLPRRILEKFKKAPIFEISPADFQEGTMFRGSVATKVSGIFASARKRPLVLRAREIDKIMESGGSSSGDSEKVADLMLSGLENELVQKNLTLLGTSSRTEGLMLRASDLIRRSIVITRNVDSLSTVIDNLDGPAGVGRYEKYYDVRIPRDAIEAAGRLGEHIYRPATVMTDPNTGRETIPLPRYTSIERVVKGAAKIAEGTPAKTVTVDQVIEATELLAKQPLDRIHVSELLAQDADSLMVFDLEGKALEAQIEGARVAMAGEAFQAWEQNTILEAMMERPEYRSLQSWERAEYAKAIGGIMSELKVFGELGRFYDAAEKRFLEGKFEVLAEASRKGGPVTMADFTKAAEAVERTNPKADKDAKDTAAKFAKEMAKKK